MENLKEEGIKKRLVFLLEKVELSQEEIQWLLSYLEQTEGLEFQKMLFESFLIERKYFQENIKEPEYKRLNVLFKRTRKELFEN